eukprot:Sdes_comp18544_c0_seq2m8625
MENVRNNAMGENHDVGEIVGSPVVSAPRTDIEKIPVSRHPKVSAQKSDKEVDPPYILERFQNELEEKEQTIQSLEKKMNEKIVKFENLNQKYENKNQEC